MSPGPHTLTDTERASFEANGFVGPFTALSPEEALRLHAHVLTWIDDPSATFGLRTSRDRHLDSRALCEVCLRPEIAERCADLLGPDLLLWRTKLFRKLPGMELYPWHQDWDFPGRHQRPALDPPVSLSCWLALTAATRENGCVRLLRGREPGPVPEERLLTPGQKRGPTWVDVGPDPDAVDLELKPGEFALFDRSVIHCSGPNTTDSERAGLALRIAPTSVRIYAGQTVDGQGHPLERWHAIQVHGSDTFGHNRIGAPPPGEPRRPGLAERLLARVRRGLDGARSG